MIAVFTVYYLRQQNILALDAAREGNKKTVQVEITDSSSEKWLGAIWNNKFKRTVTVKNISVDGIPILSDLSKITGIDTFSFLKISCQKNHEEFDL